MALGIKEQILWLDIPVGHTLAVQVANTRQDLSEAAFDLARAHTTLLDCSVQVPARAELHHLAPVLILVLNQVNSLDDIDVVKGRRNAKLRSELFHIFLLRFVLASLAELLRRREDEER